MRFLALGSPKLYRVEAQLVEWFLPPRQIVRKDQGRSGSWQRYLARLLSPLWVASTGHS